MRSYVLDPIAFVKTREEMYTSLDSIYTSRTLKPSLKALVVLTSFDLKDLMQRTAGERRLHRAKFKLGRVDDNLYRLGIEKEMPRWGVIKGDALIDVHDESWILLTTGRTYFLRHAIDPLLGVLYPEVSKVYLNHLDMLNVLNKIKQRYKGRRQLTEFTAHVEERGRNGLTIGSERIKGVNAEQKLLRLAKRNRIWLDKVAYQVEDRDSRVLLESVIYSSGLSRLKFGRFTDFYRNVLGTVLGITGELDKEYGRVKREVIDDFPVLKPCLLEYSRAFQMSHIETLSKLLNRDYAISVTHAGNPYFAAELLDPEEGSSFGLTLFENVVTVTPMLRTTKPALWRLTANIQSALGEGGLRVP
jgi:hypothetical protein